MDIDASKDSNQLELKTKDFILDIHFEFDQIFGIINFQ